MGIESASAASTAAAEAESQNVARTASDPAELFAVGGGGDDVVAAGTAVNQRMQGDRDLVAGLEGGCGETGLQHVCDVRHFDRVGECFPGLRLRIDIQEHVRIPENPLRYGARDGDFLIVIEHRVGVVRPRRRRGCERERGCKETRECELFHSGHKPASQSCKLSRRQYTRPRPENTNKWGGSLPQPT